MSKHSKGNIRTSHERNLAALEGVRRPTLPGVRTTGQNEATLPPSAEIQVPAKSIDELKAETDYHLERLIDVGRGIDQEISRLSHGIER